MVKKRFIGPVCQAFRNSEQLCPQHTQSLATHEMIDETFSSIIRIKYLILLQISTKKVAKPSLATFLFLFYAQSLIPQLPQLPEVILPLRVRCGEQR